MQQEITPERLREQIPNWSLDKDKDLLDYMRIISQNLETKCKEINTKMDGLQIAVDDVNVKLGNATNSFLAMHQQKFVENRVEEDEHYTDDNVKETPKSQKMSHSEIFQLTIEKSIEVMSKCYEKVTVELDSDSDEDDEACRKYILRPIQNFPYITRPLPHIIGSREWHEKWHAGLLESDDEPMDSEAKDDYYSDESDDENVSIPSYTNTASDRYSIPASESDLSIGSASMPKTLQNNFDTISTTSKISTQPNVPEKPLEKQRTIITKIEHKSAIKVLPTSQQKVESKTAPIKVEPPPQKVEPKAPKKGLFDNSDEENDIFQDKNTNSFFRGAQPERKTVNLFDDQPPIDDEYSKLDAAKTKKSVNLFLESDEEEDYGPVNRDNKKVNLFDNNPPKVESVKKSNLFDTTADDLSDDDFLKSSNSFSSSKISKKIVSLFDDDPPVDDFDEIFKPKSDKIVKNSKNTQDSNEPKKNVKPVNLFGEYDESDLFASKKIVIPVKKEDEKPLVPEIDFQKSENLFNVEKDDFFTPSHSKVFRKSETQKNFGVETESESKMTAETSDLTSSAAERPIDNMVVTTEASEYTPESVTSNYSSETKTEEKKMHLKLFEDDDYENEDDLFSPIKTTITNEKSAQKDENKDYVDVFSPRKEEIQSVSEKINEQNEIISDDLDKVEQENVNKPPVDVFSPKKEELLSVSEEKSEKIESPIEQETQQVINTKEIEKSEDLFNPLEAEIPEEVKEVINKSPIEDDFFAIPEDMDITSPETPKSNEDFSSVGLFDAVPPDDDMMDDKPNARYYDDYNSGEDTFKTSGTKNTSLPSFLFYDEPPDDDFGQDMVDDYKTFPVKMEIPEIMEASEKKIEKVPAKINKLSAKVNINVAALLPGARRPSPTKTSDNEVSSESSPKSEAKKPDKIEENPNILTNLTKSRPKIQSKRKPSTRNARKRQYQESMKQQMHENNEESLSIDSENNQKTEGPPPAKIEPLKKTITQKTRMIFDDRDTALIKAPIVNDEIQKSKPFDSFSVPIQRPSAGKTEIPKTEAILDDKTKVEPPKSVPRTMKNEPLKKEQFFDESFSVPIQVSSTGKTEKQTKEAILDDKTLFESQKKAVAKTIPSAAKNEPLRKPETSLISSKSKSTTDKFFDDNSDDDLFSPKTEKITVKKPSQEILTKKPVNKNIFGDSDDDDIFGKTKVEATKKPEKKSKSNKLFDSDEENDDLFAKVPTKPKPIVNQASKSLFGDEEDDDLFSPRSSKSKPIMNTQSQKKPVKKTIKSTPINDPLNLL